MIKLIVGLGNPGPQYEKTRHNAGFVFLNHLAETNDVNWQLNSQFQGEVADCMLLNQKIVLLKPMSFMNRSGMSVGKLLRYYKFKSDEVLVVHDELELAEGVVKLKRNGGHAGHNGLRDIMAHIESPDFYRLRLGIGRPLAGANVADYVLSKPNQAGSALLEDACKVLVSRMELLLSTDIEKVNNLLPAKA